MHSNTTETHILNAWGDQLRKMAFPLKSATKHTKICKAKKKIYSLIVVIPGFLSIWILYYVVWITALNYCDYNDIHGYMMYKNHLLLVLRTKIYKRKRPNDF